MNSSVRPRWPFCVFPIVLFLFAAFLAWYIPSYASIRFSLTDAHLSLETSQGRERKQEAEFAQVQAELPSVRERMEELAPQAAQAEAEIAELKARRKELRKQKEALASTDGSLTSPLEDHHE